MFWQYLFYSMLLVPLFYELGCLQEPQKVIHFMKRYKEKSRANKLQTSMDWAFFSFSLFYLILSFVGLLSSQWVLFTILILFSMVVGQIKLKSKWILQLDALVSAAILLFILLNKFHFHINLIHRILAYV